jgi:hypothetical protein
MMRSSIADSSFGRSALALAAGATPSRFNWFHDDQVPPIPAGSPLRAAAPMTAQWRRCFGAVGVSAMREEDSCSKLGQNHPHDFTKKPNFNSTALFW